MYKGEELRVAMARRNMNIDDVAEKSGVHRTTVSQIVNDKAENPQLETLCRIGQALGLEVQVSFVRTSEHAPAI